MRLIQPSDDETIEALLARSAVEQIDHDGDVYGCGPVKLGAAFDDLLRSQQLGKFRGTVGLVITEDLVASYPAPVRQNAGALLAVGRRPVVADKLSQEWALHLGFEASVGTWAAWGATDGQFGAAASLSNAGRGIVDNVGAAIAAAVLRIPCLLVSDDDWGSPANKRHTPLARWAADMGIEENLCWSMADAKARKKSGPPPVMPDSKLVRRRRAEARAMLQACTSPVEVPTLDAQPEPAGPGRVFEIGSTFDPATHYDGNYYGGGEGIRYCLPSGEWSTYHSTAHAWGGFKLIALWLGALGIGGKLLDIGAGAGAFVKACLDVGIDAWGVDISDAGRAIAPGELKPRLHVTDTTKAGWPQAIGCELGSLDVISALDLLEHIPLSDLPALFETFAELLKPGGLVFLNICTRGVDGEIDHTFEPPCEVTVENSWLLVSGHVTIRRWDWWREQLEDYSFRPRYDLMQKCQVMRAESEALHRVSSWSARNLLIMEMEQG